MNGAKFNNPTLLVLRARVDDPVMTNNTPLSCRLTTFRMRSQSAYIVSAHPLIDLPECGWRLRLDNQSSSREQLSTIVISPYHFESVYDAWRLAIACTGGMVPLARVEFASALRQPEQCGVGWFFFAIVEMRP